MNDSTAAVTTGLHTRRCRQCRHLTNSGHGAPLGICTAQDNRIQHFESEPTRFGCGDFEPREGRP